MELKEIDLYIETSIKGPRRMDGAYGYVLEAATAAGPATYTSIKKAGNTTANQSLLLAVLDAAGHLVKPCRICLHTKSSYMESAVNGWMEQWKENGWNNKKGVPVADAENWKQLADVLAGHQMQAVKDTGHGYREYLEREVAAVAAGKAFTPL